jgi:hypothetical protein
MKIEWNKVTWYSKLVAVILAVIVLALGFVFGMLYQQTSDLTNQTVPATK